MSIAIHVKYICCDLIEVKIRKDYESVIYTSALHHFKKEEKEILYKKIFECLKENGEFINSDFIAESEEFEKNQLDELDNHFEEFNHIDIPLTLEHELEILNKVGFKDITSTDMPKHSYCLIKAVKKTR